MKVSDDIKDAYKSSGGLLAISILIILVLFAIFTSSGKEGNMFKRTGALEDIREQQMELQEHQMENPRNFTVKD